MKSRGSATATREYEETLKKMWDGVELRSRATVKKMRL